MKQVLEIVQRFQATAHTAADAKIFQGFAALASSFHRVFLRQILPPTEIGHLSESSQRELKMQLKLTEVSIECLKISIGLLIDYSPFVPIDEIVIIWKRFEFLFFLSSNVSLLFILC